jgi:hypothetical protein
MIGILTFGAFYNWKFALLLIILFLFTALLIDGFRESADNITNNNDGTISDKYTGLIWQRCLVGQMLKGNNVIRTARDFAHEDAVNFASDFSDNKDNWRLPTFKELKSLESSIYSISKILFMTEHEKHDEHRQDVTEYIKCHSNWAVTERKYVRLVRTNRESKLSVIKRRLGIVFGTVLFWTVCIPVPFLTANFIFPFKEKSPIFDLPFNLNLNVQNDNQVKFDELKNEIHKSFNSLIDANGNNTRNISLADYEKIYADMSYGYVVEILGHQEGREIRRFTIENDEFIKYQWDNKGLFTGYTEAIFKNGNLIEKNENGLE